MYTLTVEKNVLHVQYDSCNHDFSLSYALLDTSSLMTEEFSEIDQRNNVQESTQSQWDPLRFHWATMLIMTTISTDFCWVDWGWIHWLTDLLVLEDHSWRGSIGYLDDGVETASGLGVPGRVQTWSKATPRKPGQDQGISAPALSRWDFWPEGGGIARHWDFACTHSGHWTHHLSVWSDPQSYACHHSPHMEPTSRCTVSGCGRAVYFGPLPLLLDMCLSHVTVLH